MVTEIKNQLEYNLFNAKVNKLAGKAISFVYSYAILPQLFLI